MKLSDIANTRNTNPPRILVHGPEKVGKSTFFAGAPNPIFVQIEDGLDGIETNAFPIAQRYQDVLDALAVLASDEHDYKTVVIDSADWLERLIHQHVIDVDPTGKKIFEESHGGYGKAYGVALTYWQEVLSYLNDLRVERKMIVGIICHSQVVPFNDPLSEPYDQYVMKLHQPKKGTGSRDLLMEWSDVIGFAQIPVYTTKQESAATGKQFVRGVSAAGQSNQLHLQGSPAYVAGNRYNLPATVDLTWMAFQNAMYPPTPAIKNATDVA